MSTSIDGPSTLCSDTVRPIALRVCRPEEVSTGISNVKCAGSDLVGALKPNGSGPTAATKENSLLVGEVTVTESGLPEGTMALFAGEVISSCGGNWDWAIDVVERRAIKRS